jgi:hypothetical protein
MPLFASGRDVANNCRPSLEDGSSGKQQALSEEARGYHRGMGGHSRPLQLKKLNLSQDVGCFSNRGEDLSGVETLAACLVST